jgi:hypothetical protein
MSPLSVSDFFIEGGYVKLRRRNKTVAKVSTAMRIVKVYRSTSGLQFGFAVEVSPVDRAPYRIRLSASDLFSRNLAVLEQACAWNQVECFYASYLKTWLHSTIPLEDDAEVVSDLEHDSGAEAGNDYFLKFWRARKLAA